MSDDEQEGTQFTRIADFSIPSESVLHISNIRKGFSIRCERSAGPGVPWQSFLVHVSPLIFKSLDVHLANSGGETTTFEIPGLTPAIMTGPCIDWPVVFYCKGRIEIRGASVALSVIDARKKTRDVLSK